ncbi:MAG: hypothetical protein AB1650_05300 [Candidatus Omnitrophota bacterium]
MQSARLPASVKQWCFAEAKQYQARPEKNHWRPANRVEGRQLRFRQRLQSQKRIRDGGRSAKQTLPARIQAGFAARFRLVCKVRTEKSRGAGTKRFRKLSPERQ